MRKFGIGQAVRRTEDLRLLTGRGRFTADLSLPGQLHAIFVRSPHAHAGVEAIDAAAALAGPGVVAVYTVADLEADGVGPLPCLAIPANRDGTPGKAPPRPALAKGRVRHVGEPVAVVVADSLAAARDAAELVDVRYRPLPAVAHTADATRPGRPRVWDDAPGNVAFDWETGDAAAVAAAFAGAAHVVGLDLVNNRVIANPLEGRACLASVEEDSGRLVLHVTSQGAHALRRQLARTIFRMPEDRLRVVTGDVGGGFGMKIFNYPEYVACLFAARRLGRPVKWVAERTEGFVSDNHGRDHVTRAEMAVDADGRFLALRVDTLANMGAYLSTYAPYIPTEGYAPLLAGVYRTPAIHARVRGVFTHTQPVDAYRGAGRPEAAFALERLVDHCARTLGLDPVGIRRRNFIPPSAMPYATPLGQIYDSGDFARNLDDAWRLSDAAGFPQRRAQALTGGKRRGLGLATYIEACSGGGPEQATLEMSGDGRVVLTIGTQSNGQGHETAYRQIIADRLGLSFESIEVVQGDTDRVAWGGGTDASRSGPVGGSAVAESSAHLIATATGAAAGLLAVAPTDIAFADGVFAARGTNRSITLAEVAARSVTSGAVAFRETARWAPPANTFPNGCHICELEVDPDTGSVRIVRYTVVDDFGTVINPMLVHGQVHGGVAQGIGQALCERVVFDGQSGQLLSGSFVDYQMPRAMDLPSIDIALNCVPCTTNALGMKGAGEAGAIGAPPAVINALVDALGVTHIDMPATPERVWRALRQARG
jgi:carbon-monoxide dehydrogenase large subunit